MKALTINLIALADAYADHRGVKTFRVGHLAAGRGAFFKALGEGCKVTTERYQRVLQWFSDHWPADLAWPADIPRPPKSTNEDAA